MDAILGFLVGMVGRLGLILAIPLAFAVVLGLAALAMRLFAAKPVQTQKPAWLAFDPEAAYASSHIWLREDGGRVRVGLDDLALRLLPGITGVQAHEGAVAAGEPLATLQLGALQVAIPAPVGGKVIALNRNAQTSAQLHGASGWLVEFETPREALSALPRGPAAKAWMDQEASRLLGFAERELGLAAADGGEVSLHSVDSVPEEKWRALLKDFLKTEPRKS